MKKLLIIFLFLGISFSCSKEIEPISCQESDSCISESIKVINTTLGGEPIAIIYSKAFSFYQSFNRSSEVDDELEFEAVQYLFPTVMKDQHGNFYDVFGKVVEGPNLHSELETVHAGLGFWFAWSSIYPKILFNEIAGSGVELLSDDPEWEVNTSFVNRGAAKDGIPSLNNPVFERYTNKDIFTSAILLDDDEIVIVKIGKTIKIYPLKILNYHEIVNDTIDGLPYVVCYAPYTNTATVWKRNISNLTLEFGVSGRIYNNNILLFDRTTSSLWNQLLEEAVNGPLQNTKVQRISYVRTNWRTWRETQNAHDILVGDNTMGFDYEVDPLGDYSSDNEYLPFPISNDDARLNPKDNVYGIEVNGEITAYQFY